jgi:inhibitor of KinA
MEPQTSGSLPGDFNQNRQIISRRAGGNKDVHAAWLLANPRAPADKSAMTFTALGDTAVVVTLGTGIDESALPRVRALTALLDQDRPAGIVDVVPAYATVTVFYEPGRLAGGAARPYEHVCQLITARARPLDSEAKKKPATTTRVVEIPVSYGGEHGPDLAEVARHCRLTAAEVIERHRAGNYLVHAIGFAPGFPYLGGLPPELHTPRRATPRLSVPAGSVGIGGAQTGIYPLSTPGGWQIIGRTPLALFRLTAAEPAMLRVGDRVKLVAITPEKFAAWK